MQHEPFSPSLPSDGHWVEKEGDYGGVDFCLYAGAHKDGEGKVGKNLGTGADHNRNLDFAIALVYKVCTCLFFSNQKWK